MLRAPAFFCWLLLLAGCPGETEAPRASDAGAGRDAAMPYLLECTVFGNHLSLRSGWLRHSERCPNPDAGEAPDASCQTTVVALVFATASPCPEDALNYRSVEVYLTRWDPGAYHVGTSDPVSVRFVRRESPYYREERAATSGQVDLAGCDVAAGRCWGSLDAASSQGDRARGSFDADLACASP